MHAHLNIHSFSLWAAAGRSCDLAVRQRHLWVNHTLHTGFFSFFSSFFLSSFSSFSSFSVFFSPRFPLEKVSRSFYKLIKIWCCMKPIWLWTGGYWSHRWSRDQHFKQNVLFQRRVWNGRRTPIWKPQEPSKPTQWVIWQRQWPHFVFLEKNIIREELSGINEWGFVVAS